MEKIDSAIRNEIIRIVDDWVPSDLGSRDTALVIVAAMFVGTSVPALTEITGCFPELVQRVADRMRASRLWTDTGVDYSDWFAPGTVGAVNFGLDLEVGEGNFIRTTEKKDGYYIYKHVRGKC
jgi:hypothetical protein